MTTPPTSSETRRPQVVIIGGGFGGFSAARGLRRAPVDVTLIDRRNFHLFQPLLYQVATGGLSPANIAAPLRGLLGKQANCQVLMEEVTDIDAERRAVCLASGDLNYDTLVVAAGARHSYFGHPEWESLAPGLKTVEDATEIRRRLLSAFEAAELTEDATRRRSLLNFVIVGAGPTGVELAGSLAEIARHSLKEDFHRINPSDARILLIEGGERVLLAYPPDLSKKCQLALEKLGVTVRTNSMVEQITDSTVTIKTDNGEETIPTKTVLWAAGVEASPLAKILATATGAELDRAGRITVEADLSLPGHPEILVLGDMAKCHDQSGNPLPGVAPVAISQGKYAAKLIRERLKNRPTTDYQYRHLGSLATIGRSAAVGEIGRFHFSGLFAWILWLVIHLMKIVTFRNRLLVLMQWGWSYFTYDRSARLITGQDSKGIATSEAASTPRK
ncbi:NAD(P)/FAD-dependent oxidoreductase [Bythopirellula polymerisocia]|uniref:NADH:ubiquinone reductase (non-electrogenic) n=1 Tax=Bythopirellula polymerisocia TaxID=2528003 RepID=A0A5C6CSS9_9BACT|nr:NAD(P)/FAD-dependent oxidoreductase [Bythopirellula polymerisocia]TWU27448.1 NADH dehydrogenase [Bythopirellula polymerisocia]